MINKIYKKSQFDDKQSFFLNQSPFNVVYYLLSEVLMLDNGWVYMQFPYTEL